MRTYKLRLGRWVVASFEVDGDLFDPVQVMADAIAQLTEDTGDYTQYHTQDDTEDPEPVIISDHQLEHIVFPPTDNYTP
jgi:hypothetical protein